jgi:8-oxo-dGTP pyrophosphatase MutT (NUDIX family)
MTEESRKGRQPREAATVILIGEESGRTRVYLLKRSSGSGFFPGSYVFPGGVLDPEDRDDRLWASSVDMDLEGISRRLGGTLAGKDALAYGVAAIRETFEEAGVFLAERNGPGGEDLERICGIRREKALPRGWLRERVVSGGWVLGLSRLAPWSHWITPEAFPGRFDTRFFLAFLPEGQECVPDERETVQGIWIGPEKGLAANLAGEIPLSPPTLITLHELLPYRTMAGLKEEVATRQWGEARLPRFIKLPEGAVIIEPWDPMYGEEIKIDPEALEDAILPVGGPFSRIWLHRGIWRPISTP